mgnify:CR=1 FL=1
MKKIIIILLAFFILYIHNSQAKNDFSSVSADGQLAQLLAPIALYPDTLLSHILMASTYPIEVVEAHRWLMLHKQLSSTQLFDQVSDKDWAPSVKALLPFPVVLKRLNNELTWTNQLGDAFLADEAGVIISIQKLRKKAEKAGNLSIMKNMDVNYEDNNIVIKPKQPEIVYVPYYDSRSIYGDWNWAYYPPVYWSHHRRYLGHQPYYWHPGVHISFNYFFSAFHWHSRHLVVISHRNSHYYVAKKRIVSSQGSKRWLHQPHHRRGVAYSNNKIKNRYKSNRVSKSQQKIISQKDIQHKVKQHKQKNRPHHNDFSTAKHSQTLKKLMRIPGDKNKKEISKNTDRNTFRPHNQHYDKKLNKPVRNDKMRPYKKNTKTNKRRAPPTPNKASNNHKIKAGVNRAKNKKSSTKTRRDDYLK